MRASRTTSIPQAKRELLQNLTLPLLPTCFVAAADNHLFRTWIEPANFPTIGLNNCLRNRPFLRNRLFLRNRPFSRNSLYSRNRPFSKFNNSLFLKYTLFFENSSIVCIGIVQIAVELENRLFLENMPFVENSLFNRLILRNSTFSRNSLFSRNRLFSKN